MVNKDFFDANILIYAINRTEVEKQSQAQTLLQSAIENDTGVISVQVISEFFTISTSPRRTRPPLSFEEATQVIEQVCVLPVVALDLSLVRRALATCRRYQISYWDGLIIAAAERAGCARLITEDLNAGQSYNGVVVVNPF